MQPGRVGEHELPQLVLIEDTSIANSEEYPDDTPYPSRLVLGWVGSRPLHVVAADYPEDENTIVITVYEPEPNQWEAGFRRRRQA